MSVFVVDASVGIKWFIPEVHTPDALRLRDPIHELHVQLQEKMVTADLRLLNALAGTPWGGHVCAVQNVP